MIISSDELVITRYIASALHGVIMSVIDTQYAEELHCGGLNPFSSYITYENGEWCWTVCTVGKTAYEKIFKVINSDDFKAFKITCKDDAIVRIERKETEILELERLLKSTFEDDAESAVTLHFNTPTAFKSHNEYIIFPDLALMYRSLMNKAAEATSDESFFDEDTLNALVQNSRIISYNLMTVKFCLEGRKINGFIGSVTVYIKGANVMKNFAKTLFTFGEYLGVGIKASLGMGALSVDRKYD